MSEIERFKNGLKARNKNIKFNQVIDIDLIKLAIDLGYADAKRTFKGISKCANEKNTAFNNLGTKILNYFNKKSPAKDWDEFRDNYHKDWCNGIKEDLKAVNATFGQAQKIVNMTMKYIYCLSNEKRNYFDYCHMALDSYILAWYNRQGIGKIKKAWSTLCEQEYIDIQNNIHKHLTGDSPKYFKRMLGKKKLSSEALQLDKELIKAEFVIWACEISFNKLKDVYDTGIEIEKKSIDISLLTNDDKSRFLIKLFDILQEQAHNTPKTGRK